MSNTTGKPDNRWLLVCLRWREVGDHLVWFLPNNGGYTADLNHAGRYTIEEAIRHEYKDIVIAVPESEVLGKGRPMLVVPCEQPIVSRIKVIRNARINGEG